MNEENTEQDTVETGKRESEVCLFEVMLFFLFLGVAYPTLGNLMTALNRWW